MGESRGSAGKIANRGVLRGEKGGKMKPERGPILGPTSIRQDVLGIAPFVREQVRAAPSGSDH